MAIRGGFSVTISSDDQASKNIDAINRRLAALRAPAERLEKSLKRYRELSGVTSREKALRDFNQTVAGGMDKIGYAAMGARSALMRLSPALAGITGIVSAGAIVAYTEQWAKFAQQLEFTARRAGIPIDKLGALSGAARLAGASAQAMQNGIVNLRDSMVNALGNRAPEQYMYLTNLLGDAWKNADGTARDVTEVLPLLADKIAALKDPTLQARLATSLFGGAAEELLPLLRQGSAGIAEYEAQARKFGVTSEDQAKGAVALKKSMTEAELAAEGLGNAIASKLAPDIAPIISKMAEWTAANRDWIASDIVRQVERFGKALDWLYNRSVGGMPEADLPTDSPMWRGIPEEQQLRYPNSPASVRRSQGLPATPPPTPGEQLGRQREAVAYFMSSQGGGYTLAQASGLAANVRAESGYDTGATGDNGQAAGIAQWHPDRQAAIAAHFGKTLAQMSYEQQLAAMAWELGPDGPEAEAGRRLRQAATAEAAGAAASIYYERPAGGDAEAATRAAIAAGILGDAKQVGLAPPINVGTGSGTSGVPGAPGANGKIGVDVHIKGPMGSFVIAKTSGDAFRGAPRVQQAMPDYA